MNNAITPSSIQRFPRVQILTIGDLLNGADLKYPVWALDATHKKAPRASKQKTAEQTSLL
jgi:hypothetical protein